MCGEGLECREQPESTEHTQVWLKNQLPSPYFGCDKCLWLGCSDNADLKREELAKAAEKELTNREMTAATAQRGTDGLRRVFLEFLKDWSQD